MKLNYRLLKNNKAFTLVELVVSLFIVSVISVLIFSSVKVLSSYSKKDNYFVNFIQAISYMEQELSSGKVVVIDNNRIEFEHDNKKYIFEFYKDMIRKTSESGGHEPVLINVNKGYFIKNNENIKLVVKMNDGNNYEKIFSVFKE